jgi:hypothetical protein
MRRESGAGQRCDGLLDGRLLIALKPRSADTNFLHRQSRGRGQCLAHAAHTAAAMHSVDPQGKLGHKYLLSIHDDSSGEWIQALHLVMEDAVS